ncbi:MAG: hypothetical protein M9899_04530 [Bdellovibrionaceae bacterium]|nr:hypothetical protein [Pseudobdellovibrionaceae bacterium]
MELTKTQWFFFVGAFTLLTAVFFVSCSNNKGLDLDPCSSEHLFAHHAVPIPDIAFLAPIGTMSPHGGSPLPKRHTGYMLNKEDVPVIAPGDFIITEIRETTYVTSPTRPGHKDYSVSFAVCAEVSGHFGHISALETHILDQAKGGMKCDEYDTVDEHIRSCKARVKIKVKAGDSLGLVGVAPHSPALDMGMIDTRTSDYVNPSRYAVGGGGSLCPWDWFEAPLKAELYPLIGDFSAFTTEAPECGSMAVDQAGTAKGRWTLQSAPANGKDPTASNFFVLAPNPYAGTTEVVISTRIAALDVATLPAFKLNSSGRVNIAPADIQNDGLIYCYNPITNPINQSTFSFLVQMISASVLRAEKVEHAPGDSVCNNAPSTWSFTGNAVNLIR